jgi:hypothetical protein
MLACDVEHIALDTVTRLLDTLTSRELHDRKRPLIEEATRQLAADGFTGRRVVLSWESRLASRGPGNRANTVERKVGLLLQSSDSLRMAVVVPWS